jgi:hypothetical protein
MLSRSRATANGECQGTTGVYYTIGILILQIHEPIRLESFPAKVVVGSYLRKTRCCSLQPRAALLLTCKEGDELRDDLIRRLIHQPMTGILDDDAFDIFVYQTCLLNEKFAGRFFTGQNQHRHR